MAERMVSRELQDINNSGKIKNGILNPNDLEENSRFILDRYMNYQVMATNILNDLFLRGFCHLTWFATRDFTHQFYCKLSNSKHGKKFASYCPTNQNLGAVKLW